MNITKNFTTSELACPCCGECEMDPLFMDTLQKIRTEIARPFRITSGYRCETHNKNIGGREDSRHLDGFAVDISIDGWWPTHLFELLFELTTITAEASNFGTGLGIYRHHIHFDLRDDFDVCWIRL